MISAVRLALVIQLSLLLSTACAQELQANFLTDKAGGCSPLSVIFTNTTTNASSSATWEWDLGNGNISTLKDPAAVFTEDKTYTIKLTVRDGQRSSVQTRTITVYRKPEFDFSITPAKGCGSLTALFTPNLSGGDGNISAWHWDFGDGSTAQTSSPSVSHLYSFEQTASVTLTAVSSYGCSNTVTKENAISVKAPLIPRFNADRDVLCDPQGTVTFSNTSSGPGTLSYLWDFGDGNTSKLASPAHFYNKEGLYTVKLTVTSSEGCTETITRYNYINVRNFSTDFDVPAITCQQRTIQFTNQSYPIPLQSTWYINNQAVANYNGDLSYTFFATGTYTVKLVNKFGGCEQEKTKQVTIHKNPELAGFVIDAPLCGAPATVKFKDVTPEAVKWKWDFNYYYGTPTAQSTIRNPEYTYNYNSSYIVRLEVENKEGCSSSVIQYLSIAKKEARITLKAGSSNYICARQQIGFETVSSDPITNTVWQFGDGTTSTEANPDHTFTRPGRYTVTLNYVNIDGCAATTTYDVDIKEKPKADFTVQSQVCGNTPVVFTNTTTSAAINYLWDFGDNTFPRYQYGAYSVMHKYQQEGNFTVQLIAYDGYCADTITKVSAIRVDPPFPKIERVTNTCDGTRGMVMLTESSQQAQTWAWSFDNGPAVSFTPPTAVSHTFSTTGHHKAVLITTNGSCTVKDSVTVPVLLKQKPVLTLTKNRACLNESVGFSITNLETNPYPISSSYHYYNLHKFEWEDGTQVPGFAGYNNYWYNNLTGNFHFTETGKGKMRLIFYSSYFNCYDTTNFVDLNITGPTAGLEIVTDKRCFNLPVVLRDTSKPGESPIVSRTWQFGDGQSVTTTQTEVSHYYNPGVYYVRLTVTDANGCSSEFNSYAEPVRVGGVKASFTLSSGSTVYQNTPIFFYNSSLVAGYGLVNWSWDFGDGTTSNEYYPDHSYTTAGTYTVKLTATEVASGCTDVFTQTVRVLPVIILPADPDFKSVSSFIGDAGACPPVKTTFSYRSNLNFNRLRWDFGDGFILDGMNRTPSHIYTETGDYIVTLGVYNQANLLETWKDTIRVKKPPVSFTATDWTVCRGESINLFSTIPDSSYRYTWDFGNGYAVNGADSSSSTRFAEAGIFIPALIVTDDKGCSSALNGTEKIVVFKDPVISLSPATPVLCKGNPIRLEATGAQTYNWSPANGLSDPAIQNPFANPTTDQVYTVEGTDANGCKGQSSIMVTVPKPFQIQVTGKTEICQNAATQLTAAGANSYLWINNTAGLSNTGISNPQAMPDNNVVYTVVGFDQYKCYTDTVVIPVTVHPLPLVNAGPDREVLIGSSNTMQVNGSSDITRWQWTPADYLSCSNCQNPVVVPRSTTSYIVSATTRYNCTSKDTITIKTLCFDNNVYIPTGFTPDNDGLNDRFSITANVSRIISLQIFNRWGEKVFEAKDFIPGATNGSWNGRYKGADAPSDTYVYIAVMECQPGTRFEKKGTITLLR